MSLSFSPTRNTTTELNNELQTNYKSPKYRLIRTDLSKPQTSALDGCVRSLRTHWNHKVPLS